jgi:hypothetical protein
MAVSRMRALVVWVVVVVLLLADLVLPVDLHLLVLRPLVALLR